jgi:molybdate transport system regulatory protein
MATVKLKLQVLCDDVIAIGPGKAELLDQIAATGSIAGAARQMGMSYRRAWQMVDAMNRCWQGRIVETIPGRSRGGAHLTELGAGILAKYRTLQANLDRYAAQNGYNDLLAGLRDRPQAAARSARLPSD